jgi:predicted methyltransferase
LTANSASGTRVRSATRWTGRLTNSDTKARKLNTRKLVVPIAALIILAAVISIPRASAAAGSPPGAKHETALAESQIPKYIVDAVNSPNRPAADRKLDASRKPEQLMAFFGIKPGMKVADLWAGGGYTTELLARAVGPDGKVYSQNMEFPEKRKSAEKMWQDRANEPGVTNVVEVTKPFDSPQVLPVPPNSLDAVIMNLNYHDMVGRGYDRDKLNAAVFKALKPGGIYGLVDNSAKSGSGARDANTLHRIDEKFETAEIEKAGFTLAATSNVLRNPSDPRTEPFWKLDHQQDRFVLKFVKPAKLARVN